MKKSYIENIFSLRGKTIVLTGAGGVLAGEMAFAAAQCDANVVVLDLLEEAAEITAEKIRSHGFTALPLQCDVLSRESLKDCCNQIIKAYGKIDYLVNAAGGNKAEATTSDTIPFFDLASDSLNKVMELNFMGTVLPCQIFGREMAAQGQGSIVNIASIAGFRPLTRASSYAAAKAAVINFTRWLAVYMCESFSAKIRVNAIAPGFFSTAQNKYLLYEEDGSLTPRGQAILSNVPQKRFGNPSELVPPLLCLLSDSSGFITGSVITADGGFDAFSGV